MENTQETDNCNRKKVNVYSYFRWSSDGQSDGDSERRQTQMAKSWCARRGLSLTGWEKDDGVSAWTGKNRIEGSGLSRLLRRLRPGDYLLIEDLDRLSRQDWRTAINFVAEIVDKGVTLVTLNNGNEITAERFAHDPGCFLPAVLRAFLGNDENQKKSERIKASWEARKQGMRNGKAANLHLPCWLAWDDDVDKPVLVENNAAVIRKFFELSLQGMGCQTVARKLHKDGDRLVVKGKRRERVLTVGTSYIWRTLRNKMCIGYGTYVEPPQPNVYPRVVSDSMFYSVQARLEANHHQTAPRASSDVNLFTGLARCSKCGGPLSKFSQCKKKTYPYLVCSDSVHRHGQCGVRSIRYDQVEQTFLSLLAHTPLVRSILNGRPEEPSVLDTLKGKLADARASSEKFFRLIDRDPNPSKRLSDALKAAEAKEAELHAQIEAETAKARTATPAAQVYDGCLDLLGRGLKPEDRGRLRLALCDFVDKIVVRLEEKNYDVYFHGCKLPITVHPISPHDWTFDPAPTWEAYNAKVAALAAS